MANTVSYVSVGKPAIAGGIWRAPAGTTLPTDATTALPEAFKCLGYVSEDGVTNANSPETDNLRAWGGDVVLNYQTEKTDTFAAALIESLNVDAIKTVYGDENVSGTLSEGITVRANAKDLPDSVYVIDTIMRGGYLKRIVIPVGKVSEVGDIVYQDETAISYPITITAMSGPDGDTHKEYIAMPAGTQAAG